MQKAVHSGLPFVVQKNENMEVYYGRRKYEYNSYIRKTKSTGNHRQAGERIKGIIMPQTYTPEFRKKIVRLHEEEGHTYKRQPAMDCLLHNHTIKLNCYNTFQYPAFFEPTRSI